MERWLASDGMTVEEWFKLNRMSSKAADNLRRNKAMICNGRPSPKAMKAEREASPANYSAKACYAVAVDSGMAEIG